MTNSETHRELTSNSLQLLNTVTFENSHSEKPIPKRKTETLPLTPGQESLWYLAQIAPDSPFYNIPLAYWVNGNLDKNLIEQAFNTIVQRHEILRTTYPVNLGKPHQQINDVNFKLDYFDFEHLPQTTSDAAIIEKANNEANKPFNLNTDTMLRVLLCRACADKHLLLVNAHHIASDGFSMDIMLYEMMMLYHCFAQGLANPLPPVNIQYGDFTLWLQSRLAQLPRQLDFWRDNLTDISPLILPYDYPRPAVQSFRGASESLTLEQDLVAPLAQLAADNKVTLFMASLSVFTVLMSRYANQTDIALGTPVQNRPHADLANMIGFFANTVTLRNNLDGSPNFIQLLQRVRYSTLNAFEHQDIPFEQLVKALATERDASRNPFFQVLFALQTYGASEGDATPNGNATSQSQLKLSQATLNSNTTHFDLELQLWDRKGTMTGYVSYSTDLFSRQTITQLITDYKQLVKSLVENPHTPVHAIPLYELASITPTVSTAIDSNLDFTEQVNQNPQHIAITSGENNESVQVTKAELNHLANIVAHSLDAHINKTSAHISNTGARDNNHLLICSSSIVITCAAMLAALKLDIPFSLKTPVDATKTLVTSNAITQGVITIGDSTSGDSIDNNMPQADLCYGDIKSLLALPSKTIPTKTLNNHKQLVSLLNSLHQTINFKQPWPLTADVSQYSFIWQTLGPLMFGGSVQVCTSNAEKLDAQLFNQANDIHLNCEQLFAYQQHLPTLSSACHLYISGGQLNIKAFKRLIQQIPSPISCKLSYLYIPPQTNTLVAIAPITPHNIQDDIPLTPTIAFSIINQHGQAQPNNVEGQLVIAAHSNNSHDLAKLLPSNGQKPQIIITKDAPGFAWINDIRINLSLLRQHILNYSLNTKAVFDAHLMTRIGQHGKQLCIYIVSHDTLNTTSLTAHCRQVLPQAIDEQMLCFISVNHIPVDINGQVKEQQLEQLSYLDKTLQQQWHQQLQNSAQGQVDQLQILTQHQSITVDSWQPIAGQTSIKNGSASHNNVINLHQTTSDSSSTTSELLAKPAIATSPPVQLPANAPNTLIEAMQNAAQTQQGIAFIEADGTEQFTLYSDLVTRSHALLGALQGQNIGAGDIVIMQMDNLYDHICCLWACFFGGITPLNVAVANQLDSRNGVLDKLYNSWQLLNQPYILTCQKLATSLSNVGDLYPQNNRLNLLTIEQLLGSPNAKAQHAQLHQANPQDVAFLQLSSGSTGTPKCIQITHQGIIHHAYATQINDNQHQGKANPTELYHECSLNWLPFDHVVPMLSFHLRPLIKGVKQYQLNTELVLANPLLWIDYLSQQKITHTWCPNFGLKLVTSALEQHPNDSKAKQWDLSNLQTIINAGEQVTKPIVDGFINSLRQYQLKDDVIVPAFGMAETCTMMTYQRSLNSSTSRYHILKSSLQGTLQDVQSPLSTDKEQTITFVDVGAPMSGFAIRITDSNNQLLNENMIGRLQLKGIGITPGYLYNDTANQEAFVGDGWFNSGDLGFIRQGHLVITGREKETIRIRGADFYCYEIEDVVNQQDGVLPTFCAAIALDDEQSGTQTLAITFVPESVKGQNNQETPIDIPLINTIRREVAQHLGVSALHIIPMQQQQFAKTTSGKIQRIKMKQQLLAGDYQQTLNKIERLQQQNQNIPQWFFTHQWYAKALNSPNAAVNTDVTIWFIHPHHQHSAPIQKHDICVTISDSWQQIDESHFSINPLDVEHYLKLLGQVGEKLAHIEQKQTVNIMHLWAYGKTIAPDQQTLNDDEQDLTIHTLRALASALSNTATQQQKNITIKQLLVVANQSVITNSEDIINPNKGGVGALVASIGYENPNIDCRHIDITSDNPLAILSAEQQHASNNKQIAYRQHQRKVLGLTHQQITETDLNQPSPIKTQGLYLITGGLGGIGKRLSKQLSKQFSARIAIIGRTASTDADLTDLPANSLYISADICDKSALQQAWTSIETHFEQAPDGVFHLAGKLSQGLINEQNCEQFNQAIAAKSTGAWHLHQLLSKRSHKNSLFVAYSSVNALLGGFAASAYCVANANVQSIISLRKSLGFTNSHAISWTQWQQTGMSDTNLSPTQLKAQGLFTIEAPKGDHSLLAALTLNNAHSIDGTMIAGLDASTSRIQQLLSPINRKTNTSEQLTAWYSGSIKPEQLTQTPIIDNFGTPTDIQIHQLDTLPTTANGEIDQNALLALAKPETNTNQQQVSYVAPANKLERTIAGVWSQVLGKEDIGVNHGFFEIGGQSVLLIQVRSKLSQILAKDISVVELLRYPTISALAKHLGKNDNSKKDFSTAKNRAALSRNRKRKSARPTMRARAPKSS